MWTIVLLCFDAMTKQNKNSIQLISLNSIWRPVSHRIFHKGRDVCLSSAKLWLSMGFCTLQLFTGSEILTLWNQIKTSRWNWVEMANLSWKTIDLFNWDHYWLVEEWKSELIRVWSLSGSWMFWVMNWKLRSLYLRCWGLLFHISDPALEIIRDPDP